MLAIDTNLIVRYLTGDHPRQAARARAIIDGESVFIPVTAILEAEWVLRSGYDFTPPMVANAFRAFAGLPNVTVEDEQQVHDALDALEKGVDFADALHLEKSLHCEGFLSFDRKFVKAAQAAGYKDVRDA